MTITCARCPSPRSRVVDVRRVEKPGGVTLRRRRVCLGCGWRWTTEEVTYVRKVRKDKKGWTRQD